MLTGRKVRHIVVFRPINVELLRKCGRGPVESPRLPSNPPNNLG
jgi:hypothetical protein